ncbi:hypothetical protein LTR17_006582 [Elasticomyces elasticus]|nr:hypothetical protein LTR17_006582 [Elasticomyces elasticus]
MDGPYLSGTQDTVAIEHAKREQEKQLAGLAVDLLDHLTNIRDFDSDILQHHMSPRIVNLQYFGVMESKWNAHRREDLFAVVEQHAANNPDYHFQINAEGASAEIFGDANRRATVWVPASCHGFQEGEERMPLRECIVRMQWRRRMPEGGAEGIGARWVCERMVASSAAGGFIGIDA